jgi:fumarate hydratase class I
MKNLVYPFTQAAVSELKVGDSVTLSGLVFTGRDRLHKFLFEGGKCPVSLKDGAVYHCGPIIIGTEGKWSVRAAGPTTSIRQEAFTPRILEQHGVRVIIGKGGMGEGTRQACAKFGCVYLQAVGGAAAVLAKTVQQVRGVHFLMEFGSAEAMWELVIKDMQGVVTMDARGQSLHKEILESSKHVLDALLRGESKV